MAYCLVQDWVEPETERSTTNYDAITARLRPLAGEAKGFIDRGWDVSVYAGRLDPSAPGLATSEEVVDGVPVRWIEIAPFTAWADRRNFDNPGVVADFAATVDRLRPDVVLATGGYVAVPTALAAVARRRPLLAHEQVVVPGLANRLIGRLATRVAVTFAASSGAFPAAKVVVTGCAWLS